MKETSKSILRRLHDCRFATRYFVGEGIDIGAGSDPLSLYGEQFPGMRSLRIWDVADGDAQKMAGIADETYHFVHSSHCLEHLVDPLEGLRNWFRILKPGGHMVVLVPDEDLYEQGRFPSIRNADHKNTFTIFKPRSWHDRSVNVTELLSRIGDAAQIVKIELLDASHRYGLPAFDQTLTPIGESAIEFVIRKRTQEEVAKGGRLPPAGALTPPQFHRLTGLPVQQRAEA
jgi:SAM-dependent methyltransferase